MPVKLKNASTAGEVSLFPCFPMPALHDVWLLAPQIVCSFVQFSRCSPRVLKQERDCQHSTVSRAWYRGRFFLCLSLDVFSYTLSRAWRQFSVFARNFDWIVWLFPFVVISWSDYCGIKTLYHFWVTFDTVFFSLLERPCWFPISPWSQTRWGAAPEQLRNERTERDRRSL